MFWNKKKEEEKFYKECLNLYEEDIKSNMKNNSDHDDILKLKNKIRNDYIEKINRNELDIMSEKIRLENTIGKYNTAFIGYSTSLYIAIMAGIFGYYFQSSGILNIGRIKGVSDLTNDIISTIAKFATFMILIFVLTALMSDKSITKNKKMSLINNVRLKVLEEIERGDMKLASTEAAATSTAISDTSLNSDNTNDLILKDSVNIYTFWKFKRRYNKLLKERFGEIDKIKTNNRIEHKLIEALRDKLNEAYSSIIKDKETYEKEKMVIKNKMTYIQERSSQTLIPVYVVIFTLLFNFVTFSQKIYEVLKLKSDNQIMLLVSFLIILIAAVAFLVSLNKEQFESATRISFYNLSLDVIENIYEKSDFYDKNKEINE